MKSLGIILLYVVTIMFLSFSICFFPLYNWLYLHDGKKKFRLGYKKIIRKELSKFFTVKNAYHSSKRTGVYSQNRKKRRENEFDELSSWISTLRSIEQADNSRVNKSNNSSRDTIEFSINEQQFQISEVIVREKDRMDNNTDNNMMDSISSLTSKLQTNP